MQYNTLLRVHNSVPSFTTYFTSYIGNSHPILQDLRTCRFETSLTPFILFYSALPWKLKGYYRARCHSLINVTKLPGSSVKYYICTIICDIYLISQQSIPERKDPQILIIALPHMWYLSSLYSLIWLIWLTQLVGYPLLLQVQYQGIEQLRSPGKPVFVELYDRLGYAVKQ